MSIGKNIKRMRELNGYTQEELGQKLNISGKTVSSWEIDRTQPKMNMVQQMSELFGGLMSDIIEDKPFETRRINGVRIPVLGRVQAGMPIEAIQEIIDYEEISEEMARSGEFFGLQIKGDSMEPKFSPGDVVIVRKQCTLENGQIGIVIVNGTDATVKRVVKHDEGGLSLIALNPSYPPKFYTNKEIVSMPVTIIGRVVELRAKF